MVNFGNVKSKLNKAYSQDLIDNTNKYTKMYESFLGTVKSSPILMLEYTIYENLKKNNLEYNESLRFIEANISALSKIDKDELLKENKKLEKFDLKEINLSEDKLTLNKNIENVINESVFKKVTNVNRLHESVNFLIESLTKKEEQKLVKTDKKFNVNNIFLLAKKKLQEKFSNMEDSELEVVSNFFMGNEEKKRTVFENYKKSTKNFLLKEKDSISSEVLSESFNFIDSLEYTNDTALNNLSKLFEIKNLNSNNSNE
jgi:hypothetical protein